MTDGAYSSNRQQMGVGLLIINAETEKSVLEYSRMYKGGTNNLAELAAVIIGLRLIKKPIDSLTVYTDSEYVRGCATLGWKRKKNQRMWEEFDSQMDRVKQLCPNIEFVHVDGHQSDDSNLTKWNNICDRLAVRASQQES